MDDNERDRLFRKLSNDVDTIKDVALLVVILVIIGVVWVAVEQFRQG